MFWQLLILQLGFFALLLLVLMKLFHGNLTKGIRSVEKLQQQNLKREDEIHKQQEAVIRDCQERIRKTDEEIRAKRATIDEELRIVKVQAAERLEAEKKAVLAQLADKEKDLERQFERNAKKHGLEIAVKMVGEAFTVPMLELLHERLVGELLDHLPKDVESNGRVRVVTALALTAKQKEVLYHWMGHSEAEGRRILSGKDPSSAVTRPPQDDMGRGGDRIVEQVDPNLIAGFVIYMDEKVLDGSLKNRFDRCLEQGV